MTRNIKGLIGYTIGTTNGEIGKLKIFYLTIKHGPSVI